MNRQGKSRWLAALTLCLVGAPALGQQPASTTDQAAALFARARPHLEEVLGRPLEKSPQFRPATVEQLRPLPDPDLEAHLRWQFPDLRDAARIHALEVALHVAASATVARHLEGSDVILVNAEQARVLARWDDRLAPAASPEFLQLALVHEAARFVLDSRYDLRRRRAACRDADEYRVLQACVDGWAQWVTRQVARRLGTEAAFPLLAERFLHAPDVGADPAQRTVSQTALRQRHWAYTQGLAFFSQLEEQGVRDVDRRVFARPPRHVGWIERPELYVRAEKTGCASVAAALARLEQVTPPGSWRAAQQGWTPDMVKQVATLLGESERAEKVLSSWDEGRSLVWTVKDSLGHQVAAVSVVRHESPAAARAYYGFAGDLQRKADTLSGGACAGIMRVLEAKSAAVALPGVEEAVRHDRRVQFGQGGPPVAATTLLARAGDLAIEFSWYGVPADLAWAGRVVDALVKGGAK
jgi:hypothetical protein